MLHAPFVPSLMKWGVSPQADLVYRTLIAFGPWSADHLGRSLEMKARQVRVALDELVALGAAVSQPTDDADLRVWAVREPAYVLARLRNRERDTMLARHRMNARLIRVSLPSIMADVARFTGEGVHRFPNRAVSRLRYAELGEAIQHENLAMIPDPAIDNATVKQAAPVSRRMMSRGVAVLCLGVPASAEDESEWFDDEMISYGQEYRELPELPGKFNIIDRKTVYVPPEPTESTRGAWEVTEPGLVAELRALFLHHWAQAVEPGRSWTPPPGLSPRERIIVMLLAKGLTDTAVASRLDLSVRTIAYTVSGLMDRYDVTNRFQLGVRLGAEAASQAPPADASAQARSE
ncbi:LuxR C-terminal-related transcriptional regulator [Catellatospora aurea]|uniref:LuxR C-terminal-related transcriptional regulator n=1 Tax=Catellatospora aurea TaxID=1337874 RepID=A0ABW2GYI5_9ACTN